jgi:xanthine dehydrogenase FAD-binding subunit
MMDRFTYHLSASLAEALKLLKQRGGEASVLAGGTDLLVQMKEGIVRPELVVDIGRLDELRGIRREKDWIWIGPLTSHRDVARSDLIRRHGSALAQGAAKVGAPQIRQQGTIGGNLANASPAADTVPPLLALKAEVEIASTEDRRWIPVSSFATDPGQTVLQPGEMVTGLRIPALAGEGHVSGYRKFGTRNALSIAVASVAAAAVIDQQDRISQVRIALGSVGPTVLLAAGAEEILTAAKLDEDLIARAADSAGEHCCPIDDVRASARYRRQLVMVLLTEVLRSWREDG